MEDVIHIVRFAALKFYDELECAILSTFVEHNDGESFIMIYDYEVAKKMRLNEYTIRSHIRFLTNQSLLYEQSTKGGPLYSIHPRICSTLLEKCRAVTLLEKAVVFSCRACEREFSLQTYVDNLFTCTCKCADIEEKQICLTQNFKDALEHILQKNITTRIKLKMHCVIDKKTDTCTDVPCVAAEDDEI